jgi:hypothetical protein
MLIDTLRDLLASDNADAWADALLAVAEFLDAYDALAPDWTSAPEDAKWAAIHPDGEGDWWGTKPIALDYRMEWDGELVHGTWWRQEPLPIGIDWRLCIWQRPEATR